MSSASINLSAVIDTLGGTANAPVRFTGQVMRGGQPAIRIDGTLAVLPAKLVTYWTGTAWSPAQPALTDVDVDCYWQVEVAKVDGTARIVRTVQLPVGHGASVNFGDLPIVDPATLTPTPTMLQTWLTQVQAQITSLQAQVLQDVPEWQPNTAYTSGELVLNASGQIVQANSAFTSGATYNASNWTILSLTLAAVQALIAAQATSDAATNLPAWTLAQAFTVVSATRDANEAITTASVVWPDGATGTFTTDTASTAFPGAIDAYHVTHVLGGVTKTVTQPAVTRDAGGAVTAQPALVVA